MIGRISGSLLAVLLAWGCTESPTEPEPEVPAGATLVRVHNREVTSDIEVGILGCNEVDFFTDVLDGRGIPEGGHVDIPVAPGCYNIRFDVRTIVSHSFCILHGQELAAGELAEYTITRDLCRRGSP